jgi:O-antigen ligase
MNLVHQYWRDSTLAHKLVAGGLFVFFALITVNWGIAKNALYIATLAAIVSLAIDRRPSVRLDKYEWLVISVVVLLVIHSLISLWVNDYPEFGYAHIRSRISKILFLIPLYLFVRKQGFPRWLFLSMVSTGAVIGGVDALMEFVDNDLAFWKRVKGGGDLVFHYAVIMGAHTVILWSVITRAFKQSFASGMALFVPSVFALFAVIVSGTRGVWLAIVVALLILFTAKRRELGIKGVLVSAGMLVILFASLWQVDYIQSRVTVVQKDFVSYFENGSKRTSLGERFELWKIAGTLGVENPIFGVGPAGYASTIKQEYRERGWNESFYNYEYPHNQFMGVFACLGIPGLILSLLLLIVPGWLFLKGWHELDQRFRNIALAGGVVVAVYFVSCLTYDHLMGRMQISVYAALIGVLLGTVKYHVLQQHVTAKRNTDN